MRRRIIIRSRCSLCGDYVTEVPDKELLKNPDEYNAEFVVTHSGYKQYIHTTCWNNMIENQKKNKEMVNHG